MGACSVATEHRRQQGIRKMSPQKRGHIYKKLQIHFKQFFINHYLLYYKCSPPNSYFQYVLHFLTASFFDFNISCDLTFSFVQISSSTGFNDSVPPTPTPCDPNLNENNDLSVPSPMLTPRRINLVSPQNCILLNKQSTFRDLQIGKLTHRVQLNQ